MSTFMRPIGPEPPTVYWLRRIAVVVVVLVVLVSLFWLVAGRGGSGDATSTSATAAPSAAPSGSAAASGSASPASTEPVECADDAITVTARTDAQKYPLGATPEFTLTIENTGTAACLRDIGPKANSLEITSGGYHVWSSDDCGASDKTKMAILQPGEKVATSITWDGKQSQKGCPADQPKAKAGNYALTGTNDGVTSDKAKFALVKG